MPERTGRALVVLVLGVRGMPGVQGGVETHAEQLYPLLVERGCQVEVLVRSPFSPVKTELFRGVRIRRLWSARAPGLEVVTHSLLGVLYAAFARPDVLHIHAIGPAIVTPLARLLGLKVVVTYHSQNYEHEKWGRLARWVFRFGEWAGMRLSHARIAVSQHQAKFVTDTYRRAVDLIPNGLPPLRRSEEADFPRSLGLEPGRYLLHVGRIAAEKRQLDLIHAYLKAKPPGWRLVLAGGLDGSPYAESVRRAANGSDIVLADYVTGEKLRQLYSHAGLFVLPSSHEGSPIALLEAFG
jgi:glycosyltransferase involved in cell wall biosynthesis